MFKEVFRSKGIKQKFLASKMGVSEVTLSNWVTGKTSPSKKNLEKLSDILDVSINEFTQ